MEIKKLNNAKTREKDNALSLNRIFFSIIAAIAEKNAAPSANIYPSIIG